MTIIIMVCASSISDGIMFGILFYVVIMLVSGKAKKLNLPILVICFLFLLKILVGFFVTA
jgi:AGZA family xanthine/uracil permease-like MFS transporter